MCSEISFSKLDTCCVPTTKQFETTLPSVLGFQVHHVSRDQRLAFGAGKCCACLGTDRPWDELISEKKCPLLEEMEEMEEMRMISDMSVSISNQQMLQ